MPGMTPTIAYGSARKTILESPIPTDEIKKNRPRSERRCSCENMEAGDETMRVASVLRKLRKWHEDSLTRKTLSRLSDRDLADIGLLRSDVDPGLTGYAERARRNRWYGEW